MKRKIRKHKKRRTRVMSREAGGGMEEVRKCRRREAELERW